MDEVADSTDWLSTPLSGLAPLESGLRCQVCKDFFTTPMITSCSHTFCSLCIRRCLSQEGTCPACREKDQEIRLRRNWAVEELVAHFTQARDGILAFARRPSPVKDTEARPRKRRKVVHAGATNGVNERRSTRSQSKRLAAPASQADVEPMSTQEEIPDSDDAGSVYQDEVLQEHSTSTATGRSDREPNDGLVQCPCCHRRMKETSINTHLDRCIQGLPTSPEPSSTQNPKATVMAPLTFTQRTKSPAVVAQQDRLPSINYALLTEAALRKKLKELGLPNHGSKELMKRRHMEWVNLWNSNCDSLKPRPKRELLRDLDTWERTLGRQLERPSASASGVMVKDFDRDAWVKSQKGEFDDLIKQAREKRKVVSAAAENEKDIVHDSAGTLMNGDQSSLERSQLANSGTAPLTHTSNASSLEASHAQHVGSNPLSENIQNESKNVQSEDLGVELKSQNHLGESSLTPEHFFHQNPPVELVPSPAQPVSTDHEMLGSPQGTPSKKSRFFT